MRLTDEAAARTVVDDRDDVYLGRREVVYQP